MTSKECLERIIFIAKLDKPIFSVYYQELIEAKEKIEKDLEKLEKLEKIKEIITLEASYVKTYSRYDRESIIRSFEKITEILNIDLQ